MDLVDGNQWQCYLFVFFFVEVFWRECVMCGKFVESAFLCLVLDWVMDEVMDEMISLELCML